MKILLLSKKDCIIDIEKVKIKDCHFEQSDIYRENIPLIFVKILRNLGYHTTVMSLGKWKNKNYDVIIVFDSTVNKNVMKYIKNKKVAGKKILYYRNAITEINKDLLQSAKECEFDVFTYNLSDSKTYGLKYNQQFWNKKLVKKVEKIKYDLYFVGFAKARYDTIVNLKEEAERQKLKTKFVIISKENKKYTQKKKITYEECLRDINQSRVIVDIVGEDNYGLTLRPLEALFYEKKLITNYLEIVNYDFYEKNRGNIFIIGKDNMHELEMFVKEPFVKNDFNLEPYEVSAWIKRFVADLIS